MKATVTVELLQEIEKQVKAGASIAEITSRAPVEESCVRNYIRGLDAARKGDWEKVARLHCKRSVLESYLKERAGNGAQAPLGMAEEAKEKKVGVEHVNQLGKASADKICEALDGKTPVDMISKLLDIDVSTVSKVQAYRYLLMDRNNDTAVECRKKKAFSPEVYEAMEARYGFSPKEADEAEITKAFRNDILNHMAEMIALMEIQRDRIKHLEELVEALEKRAQVHQKEEQDWIKQAQEQHSDLTQLNQTIRALINLKINEGRQYR